MRRSVYLALTLSAGVGCGGPSSGGDSTPDAGATINAGAAVNADAPGWAHKGDAVSSAGHRFICEGQGDTEEDALTTARAICDDKICKLCGVEIESVVETSETLTGIEMERKIIERCRRVRQGETELQRRSVDCGPAGCFAWIQIDYSSEKRERECERLTDDNFADPGKCAALIDDFMATEGHSAESFRRRVQLLEDAITACAEIDVRPTPLMQALQEKLSIGMGTFRRGAPRYLRDHWLADFPPMWAAYKQSAKFLERLELLLGYLRHKIPILDVIEATYVGDEQLDTAAALANLLAKMKAAPKNEAYGVRDIHMLAVSRLGRQADRGQLGADLSAINAWMRATYAPATVKDWSQVVNMYYLFGADGVVDADEWEWSQGLSSWRNRCQQELLRVERHTPNSREQRLLAALTALRKAKPKTKPLRALELILPSRTPELLMAVEAKLPKDVRAALTWAFLQKQLPYWDAWQPMAPRVRFVERLRKRFLDGPLEERACTAMYKRFELLEEYGVSTRGLSGPVCACLEGAMADDGTLNSGNKSALYERAVMEKMRCVQRRSAP